MIVLQFPSRSNLSFRKLKFQFSKNYGHSSFKRVVSPAQGFMRELSRETTSWNWSFNFKKLKFRCITMVIVSKTTDAHTTFELDCSSFVSSFEILIYNSCFTYEISALTINLWFYTTLLQFLNFLIKNKKLTSYNQSCTIFFEEQKWEVFRNSGIRFRNFFRNRNRNNIL